MKFKLLFILLASTYFSAFAQLSKANIEQKFPLVSLPFTLELKETPLPADDGSIDWTKYSRIKGDVGELLVSTPLAAIERSSAGVINQMLKDSQNSDIRAIGYVKEKNLTYVIFNLHRKVTGIFINVICVTSLNKDFEIIDMAQLATHIIAPNDPKGFMQQLVIYNLFKNKMGLLEMRETLRKEYLQNKAGEETVNFDFQQKGFLFGENGTIVFTDYK